MRKYCLIVAGLAGSTMLMSLAFAQQQPGGPPPQPLQQEPAPQQEPPAPGQPIPELPKVVVEAAPLTPDRTRTEQEAREELDQVPGNTGMVTEKEIDQSRAANLPDVLQFVPSVFVRSRFGAADESQISIRGSGLQNNFHLRGINVLVNGFITGSADGFSDFESLDLLSIKRIEVYPGANSLRFGANTLGGAINLVTKTGYDAGLIEARSQFGSFGFFQNYIGTGQVYGPFDMYASLADLQLRNYRDHAGQSRLRFVSTAGYDFRQGSTLRLDFGYTQNREMLPGSLTRTQMDANPRQANAANKATASGRFYEYPTLAFTARTPVTPNQVLEIKAQGNYQDLDHPLPFAVIDQITWNWGTEARYLLAAPLMGHGHRLIAGFQYFGTNQADSQFANVFGNRGRNIKDQTNKAFQLAAYVEDHFDIVPTFTLIAGARFQYTHYGITDNFLSDPFPDFINDDSGSVRYQALDPRFGFIWRVGPTAQIFGNISQMQQNPLLLEVTAPGNLQGTLQSLQPTRGWQFELGTRGNWGQRLTWDVAVYDIELRDEIQNVNVQPFPRAPFTLPRFQNISRSRHTGLEAGGDLLLLQNIARDAMELGAGGDTLRLRGAFTWSLFKFVNDVNFNNNFLPGAPQYFLRGELRYDHASGFWMAPGIESVPIPYFVDSANLNKNKPYTTIGYRMGSTYKPWNFGVMFQASNLTNVNYSGSVVTDNALLQFFEPSNARAFYGTLEWRWR